MAALPVAASRAPAPAARFQQQKDARVEKSQGSQRTFEQFFSHPEASRVASAVHLVMQPPAAPLAVRQEVRVQAAGHVPAPAALAAAQVARIQVAAVMMAREAEADAGSDVVENEIEKLTVELRKAVQISQDQLAQSRARVAILKGRLQRNEDLHAADTRALNAAIQALRQEFSTSRGQLKNEIHTLHTNVWNYVGKQKDDLSEAKRRKW